MPAGGEVPESLREGRGRDEVLRVVLAGGAFGRGEGEGGVFVEGKVLLLLGWGGTADVGATSSVPVRGRDVGGGLALRRREPDGVEERILAFTVVARAFARGAARFGAVVAAGEVSAAVLVADDLVVGETGYVLSEQLERGIWEGSAYGWHFSSQA